MRHKVTIPFEIASIDSLGQGVSKITDKVTFIPKTAVGDKGEAFVMSEKKGVTFARLQNLTEASKNRIQPQCSHFDSCPSCHFLHLDYEFELKVKKESFEKIFRNLPLSAVKVVGAPKRTHYRNRIQLHYSLKSKLLGMKDPQTFNIVPIPKCLIAIPQVLNELHRLYENNTWLNEAPKDIPEGHVEIYYYNSQLNVNWNKSYADGGFTQVYSDMNEKLKTSLLTEWNLFEKADLLDLFAGNGNLSQNLNYSNRLCIDTYQKNPGEEFYSQDLYDSTAVRNVFKEIKKRQLSIKYLLIDPPRSGIKNLSEWIDLIQPSSIAYVSCDPHTMARDLQSIKGYKYHKCFLIDFFPSTFHFETLIILERNN